MGVRFNEDTAEEIQGKSNNSEIPLKYFDIVQEHLKDEKIGRLGRLKKKHLPCLKTLHERAENLQVCHQTLYKQNYSFI